MTRESEIRFKGSNLSLIELNGGDWIMLSCEESGSQSLCKVEIG